jgi:adenine specific DNA methylase Mod
MLAYLSMMAPRLVELHRVLKPTGSIYLHCDPTASHYLKMLMDAVFGPENFRNEIIWQRSPPKGLTTRRLPQNHDVILNYQKNEHSTWNMEAVFTPYNPIQLDAKTASKYHYRDPDGRLYRLASLINPNPDRPNLTYEFLGVTKVWRFRRGQALYPNLNAILTSNVDDHSAMSGPISLLLILKR